MITPPDFEPPQEIKSSLHAELVEMRAEARRSCDENAKSDFLRFLFCIAIPHHRGVATTS